MSDRTLDFLTDDLAQEALAEAADNFFGRRKALDDDKDLLAKRLDELAALRRTVLERAATLHRLLLPENVPGFYAALGLDPGCLPGEAATVEPLGRKAREWVMPKSWAWTGEGEYEKLVITAYAAVQDRLDEYLHGRVFVDSKTGKKVISVCLDSLTAWLARLNARLAALNRAMPASATLGFVKSLHPHEIERERILDSPVDGLAQSLDQDMALTLVDSSRIEAMAFPPLPSPEDVREAIADYCGVLYARHRETLRVLLDEW